GFRRFKNRGWFLRDRLHCAWCAWRRNRQHLAQTSLRKDRSSRGHWLAVPLEWIATTSARTVVRIARCYNVELDICGESPDVGTWRHCAPALAVVPAVTLRRPHSVKYFFISNSYFCFNN